MPLRGYQRELLEEVESDLTSTNARVMLQLPTGGGKTVIAGELLARRLRANRESAAVWLTHRVELAEQTRKMLTDAGVNAISRPRWNMGQQFQDAPKIGNGVAILTAQTVARREPAWLRYGVDDLLVVDEAHHATASTWEAAIKRWPGPVLGMTATPWLLSKTEGFDHLFDELRLGLQTHQLQADGHLCQAKVIDSEDTIIPGAPDGKGDFTERGIFQANQGRPRVLTTGVLNFWRDHAVQRQTIIYAVSIEHARNLEETFRNAEIDARAIYSEMQGGGERRREIIELFRNGTLRVLINVEIATEGFDLPDASCVVLARPTMSLTLYLQMVGRGLRPKPPGSQFDDCLILDIAGNAKRHGQPEHERVWFLEARGNYDGTGEAWVIRCENCGGMSSAANHSCVHCGAPFGKDCQRCGRWRAWKWWEYETHCSDLHDRVCDLCHYDLHFEPVTAVPSEPPRLGDLHQRVDARIEESKGRVQQLDLLLRDPGALDEAFNEHVASLPIEDQPVGPSAIARMFPLWERQLRVERERLQAVLIKLEGAKPDGSGLLEEIHNWLRQQLDRNNMPSRPHKPNDEPIPGAERNEGLPLSTSWRDDLQSLQVVSLQPPDGPAIPVEEPDGLLKAVAEWLIGQGHISKKECPILQSPNARVKCLINTDPRHLRNARNVRVSFTSPVELSNGLYLENDFGDYGYLLERFGQDPFQFRVNLRDRNDETSSLSLRLTAWTDRPYSLRIESMRTPSGQVISAESPGGLLVGVAEWLIKQGLLRSNRCPVKPPRALTRYLVNTEPRHSNGLNFTSPARLPNGLYLELAGENLPWRCAQLLECCGQEPSQFRVNVAEIQDENTA